MSDRKKNYLVIVRFGYKNAPSADFRFTRLHQSRKELEAVFRNITVIEHFWYVFSSVNGETAHYIVSVNESTTAEHLKECILYPDRYMIHRKDPDMPLLPIVGAGDALVIVDVGNDAVACNHTARLDHSTYKDIVQLLNPS